MGFIVQPFDPNVEGHEIAIATGANKIHVFLVVFTTPYNQVQYELTVKCDTTKQVLKSLKILCLAENIFKQYELKIFIRHTYKWSVNA